MHGFEDVDAAGLVVVAGDGGQLAGLAELSDEHFADLEQYCDQFEGHAGHSFFLALPEQEIQLRDEVVVDDGGDA